MKNKILKNIGLTLLIYSLLVFIGGVIGFVLKGSIPSLVMGGSFGLLLLLSSVKTLTFKRWGLSLGVILVLLLDLFFSYRCLKTYAFFPAGLMFIFTTLTLAFIIIQLRRLPKKLSPN